MQERLLIFAHKWQQRYTVPNGTRINGYIIKLLITWWSLRYDTGVITLIIIIGFMNWKYEQLVAQEIGLR